MSGQIDPSGSLPPVGHTDERGNFHWGSPADRAERIARDNTPPPLAEPERNAAENLGEDVAAAPQSLRDRARAAEQSAQQQTNDHSRER